MFSQWFIPTCSMVFRNNIILPEWFNDVISGDFTLQILIAEQGKVYYLKENMAVYRLHDGGVSRFHNGYFKAIGMLRIFMYLDIHFNGKYRDLIDKQIEYEIDRYVVKPNLNITEEFVKRKYESKKILKLEKKINKFLGRK